MTTLDAFWERDVYSTVEEEFDAANNSVAVVTRPRFGRIEVTGADRLDLLHRLSTNDLLGAQPGQIVATVFTTDKARIVDYVYILVRGDSLLALSSPGNEVTFMSWIDKYTIMEDIQLKNTTPSTSMISFIGPQAKHHVERLLDVPVEEGRFVCHPFGAGEITVSCHKEYETTFVNIISGSTLQGEILELVSGGSAGTRMGTIAYEAFRISRGIPQLGTELNVDFNPLDIGLVRAISFRKGCYIGQEVIARLDTYQKVQKLLVGVHSSSSQLLYVGARLIKEGIDVGYLTSVCNNVIHNMKFGIAVVKKDSVSADDPISIVSEHGTIPGVGTPFPILP